MDGPLADAYVDASAFFVDIVDRVRDDQWNEAGLGEWTVRELVGHANRGHSLIEEHVLHPSSPLPSDSPYFGDEQIADRGRQAAEALGPDPRVVVRETSRRVVQLVRTTSRDATVGSPVATMTLGQYLPSRIAELTIHAIDLEVALDLSVAPPLSALEESLAFVARRAARRDGTVVLRSLSGRADLPTGYSVF